MFHCNLVVCGNECGTNVERGMSYGKEQIIRSHTLFNTIVTNEIFRLHNLEQLVTLHSSILNTIHHNFSVTAILFQLMEAHSRQFPFAERDRSRREFPPLLLVPYF